MISFDQIPSRIGVPGAYVELDGTRARLGQAGKPYKLVVYGQMAAKKTANNLLGSRAMENMPIQINSAGAAKLAFGAGSLLAASADIVFKINSINECWFIPQYDDAAGVARVVTADYTTVYTTAAAAPFAPGVERVYIGDRTYRVAVRIGDTAAVIATALAAVINADVDALFSATAAAGVLTMTAKNKGEVANDVQFVSQYHPSDVSASNNFVTFTQTVAGAQNPDISAGIASASSMYMTHVVMPYNDADNYALLVAEAQDRAAPLPSATSLGNGQDDFVAFCAFRGTEAQAITFMENRNCEWFTTAYIEPGQVIKGVQFAGLMSSSFQFASAYAAMSARLTSVVCNNPHQRRVLNCLKPSPSVGRAFWNVRNRSIMNHGMATYNYNQSNQVMLEAGITERTLTDSGLPTDAEYRVETQFQKSYCRWSLRVMAETRYPHSRLADDGNPGLPQNVVTPKMLRGDILALCSQVWIPLGIVENYEQFAQDLIVERSTEDCNTIKVYYSPDFVNIFSVLAAKLAYIVC
jgi:phage tail sheath gpL-like